jgi:hypothetical protein
MTLKCYSLSVSEVCNLFGSGLLVLNPHLDADAKVERG